MKQTCLKQKEEKRYELLKPRWLGTKVRTVWEKAVITTVIITI